MNVFYTQLEGHDNAGLAEVCNSSFDNERQMTETQNSERRLDGDNEHVKKLRKSVGEVIKKEIGIKAYDIGSRIKYWAPVTIGANMNARKSAATLYLPDDFLDSLGDHLFGNT